MIKRANTPVINSAPFSATQRGATLVVALFMLLLISLLAVGGMQGSIMQERMPAMHTTELCPSRPLQLGFAREKQT